MESASVPLPHGAGGHAVEHEHHGPPEANKSSRIDKQTLGILLFIVSEVMLFGSFFASYFFLRVVVNPEAWPPHPFELPVAVAGNMLLPSIICRSNRSKTIARSLAGALAVLLAALCPAFGLARRYLFDPCVAFEPARHDRDVVAPAPVQRQVHQLATDQL